MDKSKSHWPVIGDILSEHSIPSKDQLIKQTTYCNHVISTIKT